jgi:hypothetical protein
LAITMSMFKGTGAGDTTAIRAYGTGLGDVVVRNNIAANEWINVWLVVNNANKTYKVATSTGTADGVLFPTTFSFGRQSAAGEALDTFAGAEFRSTSNPANASVRIDDLTYLFGENLINPLSASPGLFVEPALLRVEGNFTALAGSTLELDLFDPAQHDRLEVTGTLTAGGSLKVMYDPSAPAPAAGDAFDLFDFAAATGAFDEIVLPTLGLGLVWDLSQIYATGALAIAAGMAGDYNNNGYVDAADYTVWRNNLGAPPGTLPNDAVLRTIGPDQYTAWKANYGLSLFDLATAHGATIPEPSSLALLVVGALLFSLRKRSR